MRQDWEPEDLVAAWTLVEDDWRLVANKTGPTRLGFAVLLKFFEQEGRFPASANEVPPQIVDYIGAQVKVDGIRFREYRWSGRTIEYHRAQIRNELGFRVATRDDEAKLTRWLAEEVAPSGASDKRLNEALLSRCRVVRIEPPGRPERIIAGARAAAAEAFCARTLDRLPEAVATRLEALVDDHAIDAPEGAALAELKADPERVSLASLLAEVDKLERIRSLGLPPELFAGVSDAVMTAWRARAAVEYPSDLQDRARPLRLTLLAALCWCRTSELTDSLIDLLLGVVLKLNSRAERRVQQELLGDLKRVQGKEAILFRLAEAALEHPDETVREALYPVVGEQTLRDLVSEARADKATFQARVRAVLRSSYSSHYRRMLAPLLRALDIRSNNAAHCPVIEALDLLRRYSERPGTVRFYAPEDEVPLEGVVPGDWREAVVDHDGRVERIPYELCVLRALRDGLRRRELWVVGARRWRNPDEDLPADFELNRDVHYAALRQPLDATTFIADLKAQMVAALARLETAVSAGTSGGVRFTTRHGEPWVSVPKLERLDEPPNLARLKQAVVERWGTLDLLDLLKEADLRSGLTEEFTSVASREVITRSSLRRRLRLVLFALGTNVGIKQIASGDHGHGETEAALRHVRRLYVNPANLRRAIARVVNATFAERSRELWGEGTACASDSRSSGPGSRT